MNKKDQIKVADRIKPIISVVRKAIIKNGKRGGEKECSIMIFSKKQAKELQCKEDI